MAENAGGDSRFFRGVLVGLVLGVLIGLGIGGTFLVIEQQRRHVEQVQRKEAAQREVNRALGEAKKLLDQTRWEEAKAVQQRAEALLEAEKE
jgi:hypothetical protein